MNFLLDTNAFYSFYGREKLGLPSNLQINEKRLRVLLTYKKNTIYISSITLFEILSLYYNDLDKIRKLLKFIIYKEEIHILNLGIDIIDYSELILMAELNDNLLREQLKKYIKKKVRAEAGLAASFLLLQLNLFLNFIFDKDELANETFKNLDTSTREHMKIEVFDNLLFNNTNKILETNTSKFSKVLQHTYKLTNQEKTKFLTHEVNLKDAFNKTLFTQCEVYICYWHYYLENYKALICTSKELFERFCYIYNTNEDRHTINQYSDNANAAMRYLVKQFEALNDTAFLNQHLEKIEKMFENDYRFTKHQQKYIAILINKWMNEKKKYEKNDLLDMLILGGLDTKEMIVLSFDKKLGDFISSNSAISKKYIDRCKF